MRSTRRQRFVQDLNSAIGVTRPGFSLGQRHLDEPVEGQSVLLAQALNSAAHGRESLGERAAFGVRPAYEKLADRAEQGEFVIAHDSREFGDARTRLRAVASHQREKGRKRRGVRERGGVR